MSSTPVSPWSPELADWLAYAVVTGHSNEIILAQLSHAELSHDSVLECLEQLRRNPLTAIGQRFAAGLSQLQWLLETQERVRRQSPYPAVPTLTPDQLERARQDYLFASRPVKIQGLMENWPALAWTAESLRSRWGQHLIEYTEHVRRPEATEAVKRQGSFAEFLDRIAEPQGHGRYYWTAYNQESQSNELITGLAQDVRSVPVLCRPELDGGIYFWIGPGGTRSGLHFDPYNVLFLQVHGHKRFYLLPPSSMGSLYLQNDYFSPVDLENPSFEHYPLAQGLEPIVLEIGPGEALLLPVGWFHQVTSASFSISVSLTNLDVPGGNSYPPPSAFTGRL